MILNDKNNTLNKFPNKEVPISGIKLLWKNHGAENFVGWLGDLLIAIITFVVPIVIDKWCSNNIILTCIIALFIIMIIMYYKHKTKKSIYILISEHEKERKQLESFISLQSQKINIEIEGFFKKSKELLESIPHIRIDGYIMTDSSFVRLFRYSANETYNGSKSENIRYYNKKNSEMLIQINQLQFNQIWLFVFANNKKKLRYKTSNPFITNKVNSNINNGNTKITNTSISFENSKTLKTEEFYGYHFQLSSSIGANFLICIESDRKNGLSKNIFNDLQAEFKGIDKNKLSNTLINNLDFLKIYIGIEKQNETK